MRRLAPPISLLLFGSGLCALIYEIAWLRMLRLTFGASTAASAAVLAIFLGGLGFGGLLFGRRADRARRPLRLYANLELGVALAAAASPVLMALVRRVYLGLGGTASLGLFGGTVLRLALSTLVLGVPTLLMGGTLPAAGRAVERTADRGRRELGWLYGANTLGAVAGSLWATFFALEWLGTSLTVWLASVLNVVIALVARGVAALQSNATTGNGRPGPKADTSLETPRAAPDAPSPTPAVLVLVAAAVVGFAFLLMELVWYRMLAPLLGGSSYTFGLILTVALLGIGLGGLLYAIGPHQRRPTLIGFALTCVIEALCIVVPYALGDRIAVLTLVLLPLGFAGFAPLVAVWLLVTLIVVFPAAVLAGYQFPLLVALLGAGEQRVGRQVGWAYAANTFGAIAGSLSGGFGLLPLLSAPGVWRAAVFVLVALAGISVLVAQRRGTPLPHSIVPITIGLASVLLCGAEGPTAFWRHSPIGVGRVSASFDQPNDLQHLINSQRRQIEWEVDGVESAVALNSWDAYALIVHGKSDGNVIDDAPTQIMAPLLGAFFHPDPRRVLIIGLGTGTSAGWLAKIPTVERVDVVELEPAVKRVAAVCSPVTGDVLSNPKVNVISGDGREFLLTTSESYDLIFSEPSNLYRAGVASLFTQQFYAAVAQRLRPSGIFSQWIQAYEVQAQTVATVYATLGSVFPSLESWEVGLDKDLLLVASRQPIAHDLALVRSRVEVEPYRSALARAWGVRDAEGLYTGYVAGNTLAETLKRVVGNRINTDDHTLIEFQFARAVGRERSFSIDQLRTLAARLAANRPQVTGDPLDWAQVDEWRTVRAVAEGRGPTVLPTNDVAAGQRMLARQAYANDQFEAARLHWSAQDEAPQSPVDLVMVAEILAVQGDPAALAYIEQLRPLLPAEAEILLAIWCEHSGMSELAVQHLVTAFETLHHSPWSRRLLSIRALELATRIATQRPQSGAPLFEVLKEPFAVHAIDGHRLYARVNIGLLPKFEPLCVEALSALEPYPVWERSFLEERLRCYTNHKHPLAPRARADLERFLAAAPVGLDTLLSAVSGRQ